MEIFGDGSIPLFVLRFLSAKAEKSGEIYKFYSKPKKFASIRGGSLKNLNDKKIYIHK